MIAHVKAKNILDGWKKSLLAIFNEGEIIEGSDSVRDSTLVLEIEDIADYSLNSYSAEFPITYQNILTINKFIVDGSDEEKVIHEWTKLYRKRLVNDKQNQISEIIDYLRNNPSGKRAQASIWNQEVDLYSDIGPCLQILWFQIINNKLVLHVHMRASDAYGKLLMNIHEFASLQRYVATRLGIKCGRYYQFVDTCHINKQDLSTVKEIVSSW